MNRLTVTWLCCTFRLQDIIYHYLNPLTIDYGQLVCSFEAKWKVDTSKCVDASPLLVQDKSCDSQKTVYIGSHSGKFFAICFLTGRVLWEKQLTDRVESSACLSTCGQFVTVGKVMFYTCTHCNLIPAVRIRSRVAQWHM